MADPVDEALLAGMRPTDHQVLDLSTAPRMKNPRNPVANLLTRDQVASLQSRGADLPPPTEGAPTLTPLPTPPVTAPAGIPPVPGAQAIPVPAAPTTPRDTPRVRDRINQLWGQKKDAEERAAAAESRLADILSRVEARFAAPPATPPTIPSGPFSFEPGQPPPVPPAGDFVSRVELQAMLDRQTRQLLEQQTLTSAHSVSRLEAERDIPAVGTDPELKACAEEIFQRDPYLRQDPRGPYKAALMAAGLAGISVSGSSPPPGGLPAAARKEALAGVGVSAPSSQGAPEADLARYEEAMRVATATGKVEDAARALLYLRSLRQNLP